MNEEKYLENIKKGDLVFVSHGYQGESFERVIKVTKTQIHVEHIKFRRNTGYEIGGDSLRASHIIPLTPEEFEKKKAMHTAKGLAKKVLKRAMLLERQVEEELISLQDVTDILNLINSKINQG